MGWWLYASSSTNSSTISNTNTVGNFWRIFETFRKFTKTLIWKILSASPLQIARTVPLCGFEGRSGRFLVALGFVLR